MNRYKVNIGKRNLKFETMEAASQFCNEAFNKTGIVLSIEEIKTKATAARINAEIAKLGGQEVIWRGEGYYYFTEGHAHEWFSSSVYVCYLHQMSLERWIEAYKNLRDDPKNAWIYDEELRKEREESINQFKFRG